VSYIASGNIEADSLTSGSTNPSSITFDNPFTVVPQVSVAVTGLSYNNPVSPLLAWVTLVSGITMSGCNIATTAFSAFTFIKSQWVATQGDTLQLFHMTDLSSSSTPIVGITNTPFDYAANVQFASPLPEQVFVATLITSYQLATDANGLYTLVVLPTFNN
jgi:hypothetical protein